MEQKTFFGFAKKNYEFILAALSVVGLMLAVILFTANILFSPVLTQRWVHLLSVLYAFVWVAGASLLVFVVYKLYGKHVEWLQTMGNWLKNPVHNILFCGVLSRVALFFLFQPSYEGFDSISYADYPYNIFAGETSLQRPPVYPYFLKIVRVLMGADALYDKVALVQGLIGLVTAVILYFALTKIISNKPLILFAMWHWNWFLGVTSWERCALTETLAIFGAVVLLYLLAQYLKKQSIALAFAMGVWVLFLQMLRPAFIWAVPVLAVFFLLRMGERKERKTCVAGLLGVLVCVVGMQAYSGLNARNYGLKTISNVGSVDNHLAMVITEELYRGTDDIEMETYITELLQTPEAQSPVFIDKSWPAKEMLRVQFGEARCAQFAQKAILANLPAFIVNRLGRMVENTVTVVWTCVPVKVVPLTVHWQLSYMMMPVCFGMVYIMVLYELAYFVWQWGKKKEINWLSLGLGVCIGVQTGLIFFGANGEYSRLFAATLPFFYALTCLQIERLLQWANSKKKKE